MLRSLSNFDINNPGITTAYFNAIDVISSNTEAGSTLRYLIKNYKLNNESYTRLLGSVKKLSSNTEMGSVMRSMLDVDIANPKVNVAYFLVINTMSSNSES